MRLDHLLSKENRVICFVTVWVLVSTWLVASFCFQVKTGIARISCVWFWELMKQEFFAVFQPLLVVKGFAE